MCQLKLIQFFVVIYIWVQYGFWQAMLAYIICHYITNAIAKRNGYNNNNFSFKYYTTTGGGNGGEGGTSSTSQGGTNPFAQQGLQSFITSLMVLSAHVIQADGRIMHSEMEFVRQYLRRSFGEWGMQQGDSDLRRFFEYRKQNGEEAWNRYLQEACAKIRMTMPMEHRLQLIAFLAEIAKADGSVGQQELTALRTIASSLGLNPGVIDQMLSLGGATLDDAYKVLGISPDATDDEVRKAYRKMALQYHPDKVATLGDDVKEAAKRKFQEINDAKERIYKARGL